MIAHDHRRFLRGADDDDRDAYCWLTVAEAVGLGWDSLAAGEYALLTLDVGETTTDDDGQLWERMQ